MTDPKNKEPIEIDEQLFAAIKQSHPNLERVKQLLDAGANVHATDSGGKTSLFHAVYHVESRPGQCAIAWERNADIVQLLLSAGANPNHISHAGNTPLLLAVVGMKLDIVQLLINAGADVNFINTKSPVPSSVLWEALYPYHVEILRLLLHHGADPNQIVQGQSAFHRVAQGYGNKYGTLELMLSYGADMYKECPNGPYSPFDIILRDDKVDEVRLFFEHGFNLDEYLRRYPQQLHPLCKAVTFPSPDMMSVLLEHAPSNLKCLDRRGRSPLLIAASEGSLDHVKLLLQAGADPNYGGPNNKTPLEVAIFSHQQCMEKVGLLVAAGAKFRDVRIPLLPTPFVDEIDEELENRNIINGESYETYMARFERNRARLLLESAKCVVKYKLFFKVDLASVEEQMKDDNGEESVKLRRYYETCKDEIALLKNSKLGNSITYYDIIEAEDFGIHVRNEKTYQAFDMENLESFSPIYAKDLYGRFKRARKLHEMWESAIRGLNSLIGLDVDAYYPIYFNILIHLCDEDLCNLGAI